MSRKVTLDELSIIASNCRESIWAEAQSQGREPKIYLHWTAGGYYSIFNDYHINITGDGAIYITSEDLSEVKNHTWRRNTGSIGIALCCCVGGGSTNLGSCPPTSAQIEAVAQVIDRFTRHKPLALSMG